jgi:hypothetical protein
LGQIVQQIGPFGFHGAAFRVVYAERLALEKTSLGEIGLGYPYGEWFEGIDEQRFAILGGRFVKDRSRY